MNGVIYARYSCEKQTENSILGQVRECKLFAERNGINVIDVYKDEAISGRTATKRPAFMKMIHDASLKVFDCIIVWKGDRFSRSRADAAKYKSELKKLGVRVLSATEANVTGPEAILMDGINEAFAEYFSVELAAKVERGMTQNAIDGKFNGGRLPFGYKIENGKILIDECAGAIVRELFDLYTKGQYNLTEIVELFKNKGYTKNGESLKKSSIYRIIQNPRYYGHYEFKGTVNDNMFPAIVSKEIWDKARARAEATHGKAGKYKAKAPYLLTGKLICGECFTYMRGDSCYNKGGKQFFYYICPGKRHKNCSMESVPKDKLEDVVVDAIVDFIWNKEDIEFYISELAKVAKTSINCKADQIQGMLNETNKSIRNITKAIEQGADFELMIPRLNELKVIKDEQEQSLNRAKLEEGIFDEKSIRKFIESLRIKEYISLSEKKYLISTLVDSIYLFKDNSARIVFKFSGSNGEYIIRTGGVRLQTHSVHHSNITTPKNWTAS